MKTWNKIVLVTKFTDNFVKIRKCRESINSHNSITHTHKKTQNQVLKSRPLPSQRKDYQLYRKRGVCGSAHHRVWAWLWSGTEELVNFSTLPVSSYKLLPTGTPQHPTLPWTPEVCRCCPLVQEHWGARQRDGYLWRPALFHIRGRRGWTLKSRQYNEAF